MSRPLILPHLFVIGDSISIRYGPQLERLLAGRYLYDRKSDHGTQTAESNLDIALGANGGDSRMVLDFLRFRRASDPIRADILLINCGLHDIKTDPKTGARQVCIDEYARNLEAILEEASAMDTSVVWVRTTPVIDEIHNSRSHSFHRYAKDVTEYNEKADRIMEKSGIPAIDLHAFSLKLLPEGFIDHVHYTEEACSLQADFLAEALLEMHRPRY